MITEDYVSFEIAKLLREKGFNEPCFAYYDLFHDNAGVTLKLYKKFPRNPLNKQYLNVPTLQAAMKWLRKVYNFYVEVYILKHNSNKTVEYCITIEDLNFPGSNDGFHIIPSYESYEGACDAAIRYCLENLI